MGRVRIGTAVYTLLAAFPGATLAQQSDADWLEDCQEDSDRGRLVSFCEVRVQDGQLAPGPIRVDPGANGGVAIVGWEQNRIEVHARIQAQARTEGEAETLASDVTVASTARIEADGPSNGRNAHWHVSFLVYVPAASDLEVETLNGGLSVRGVNGRMRLDAQNGPIDLREVGGDVLARAQNGPLNVALTGTQWTGTGLDAETMNGPVTLTIPTDYNATLESGTVNGSFSSDVPITMTLRGRIGRPFTGTLGRGGPTIRAVTTNGPVRIRGS